MTPERETIVQICALECHGAIELLSEDVLYESCGVNLISLYECLVAAKLQMFLRIMNMKDMRLHRNQVQH